MDDCGQERIGSRWVITQEEKADGQKAAVNGKLLARGFKEQELPKSDSPTILNSH